MMSDVSAANAAQSAILATLHKDEISVVCQESSSSNGSVLRSSSIFSPSQHGWKPTKLPELASNGFPFAPTFLIERSENQELPALSPMSEVLPFGFHFRVQLNKQNQPVVDLTRGYYDPQTQIYTIPLCANGGETQGGTYLSGEWTSKGDGTSPQQEWDVIGTSQR